MQRFEVGGRYARTREHAIQRMPRGATHVLAPDRKPSYAVKPFEIWMLGLLNFYEFRDGTRFGINNIFEEYLGPDRLVEVVAESPNLHRLSWTLGNGRDVKRTIWFDEKQGFAPVRMEERYALRRGSPARIVRPFVWAESPRTLCEGTWAKVADIWVPQTFRIEHRSGVDKPPYKVSRSDEYSLSFTWTGVNAPVPKSLFEPDALAAPGDPQIVIDHRHGAPVVVKHPNVQDPSILKRLNNQRVKERRQVEEAILRKTPRMMLIVVNGIALVVIGAYLTVRHYRRRNHRVRVEE